MTLLIVEDQAKTLSFLRKGLTENGYAVETATTGPDGLKRALAGGIDLIVLDVMLPEMDGWQVLRELRAAAVATPVLFLTAKDRIPDRVKGLELGAEDYLVKPFAFAELLARIQNVLRRVPARPANQLAIGDLELDLSRQRATRSGTPLELTAKEFVLLALLANRAGTVLSRSLIAKHVWDVDFDPDTNVVDVHIRRLRAKVDDPFEQKLIHTIRGVGYVLESRA
jgi:two-component system copper resistance phosphate regulon response regulator CusR